MRDSLQLGVRAARSGDTAAIAELFAQLGYDVPLDALAGRIDRPRDRREIFVAAREESVVACAVVSVDEYVLDGIHALVEAFVVDERLRSTGIGARLLAATEAWARERGCSEIRVRSNVVRERARGFYEREGYAKVKAQYVLRKAL